MFTMTSPVSDMLMTVKSREVQRGMLADMRGDRPSATRHFLARAHLELVIAADLDEAGEPDLAERSRISAISCFWRAGDTQTARDLMDKMLRERPERAAVLESLLHDLEQNALLDPRVGSSRTGESSPT